MDCNYCQIIIDRLLLSILWKFESYWFNVILINMPIDFKLKIWFSNLFGNINNTLRTAKTILKRKNKVEGIFIIWFKTHCKAVVTRTTWYCHKGGHVSHKSAESLEIDPSVCGQLIVAKITKIPQRGKG